MKLLKKLKDAWWKWRDPFWYDVSKRLEYEKSPEGKAENERKDRIIGRVMAEASGREEECQNLESLFADVNRAYHNRGGSFFDPRSFRLHVGIAFWDCTGRKEGVEDRPITAIDLVNKIAIFEEPYYPQLREDPKFKKILDYFTEKGYEIKERQKEVPSERNG